MIAGIQRSDWIFVAVRRNVRQCIAPYVFIQEVDMFWKHFLIAPVEAHLTPSSDPSNTAYGTGNGADLLCRTILSIRSGELPLAGDVAPPGIIGMIDGFRTGLRKLYVWLRTFFDRIETLEWRSQAREFECYLAQSQNLADLEDRIRRYDRATISRGRALC